MLLALTLALGLLVAPLVDVALDPGHSTADIGSAGGGLREYDLTLDLAVRVQERLIASGRSVRLTRTDTQPLTSMDEPDPTDRIRIEQTARIAAGSPARVYVSLHFNGGPATWRGTETYFNPDRGPAADALDLSLAQSIQQHVVTALAEEIGYLSLDRGAKNDLAAGKPYGHFFSLSGPEPSALLEPLFLSNPTEAALLRQDATREAIADGCAQGLLEYLAGLDD